MIVKTIFVTILAVHCDVQLMLSNQRPLLFKIGLLFFGYHQKKRGFYYYFNCLDE